MTDEIQPDKRTITNNPAASGITIKTDWRVKPLVPGEYDIWMAQNQVEPLICNQYIPKLREAIKNAQHSIYITVWGFDAALPLVSPSELRSKGYNQDTILGEALKARADDGVDVKVIVFYNSALSLGLGNFPGYRTSLGSNRYAPINGGGAWDKTLYREQWVGAASNGHIINLQLSVSPGPSFPQYFTEGAQSQIDSLEQEVGKIGGRQIRYGQRRSGFGINRDYRHPYEDDPALMKADGQILKKYNELNRSYTQGLRDQYTSNGLTFPSTAALEGAKSHHQKAIVIDHESPKDAVGFVQGFNLLPEYFDDVAHNYDRANRFDEVPYQDIGAKVQGGCIPDLFRNFKDLWKAHASQHLPISKAALSGALYSRHLTGYQQSAQILRTYPSTRESNIEAWIYRAISRMNSFLYIEDQYFRHAGFAKAIIKRAQQKSPLYVFVVTIPTGAAGGQTRQDTLTELNRSDLITSEKKAEDEGSEKLEESMIAMKAAGVYVHVCRLRTSKTQYGLRTGQGSTMGHGGLYPNQVRHATDKADYKDIYVHSKLTIVDNAHYIVGSANHNVRSMQTDTELAIAVEDTRVSASVNSVQQLRTDLWNEHVDYAGFNRWDPDEAPLNWYDSWQDTLDENNQRYWKKEPRISDIFTLYEDGFKWEWD